MRKKTLITCLILLAVTIFAYADNNDGGGTFDRERSLSDIKIRRSPSCAVFSVTYTKGVLTIISPSGTDGDVTVTITNNETGNATQFTINIQDSETLVKVALETGEYTITLRTGDGEYQTNITVY